jgi:hypothetical protein
VAPPSGPTGPTRAERRAAAASSSGSNGRADTQSNGNGGGRRRGLVIGGVIAIVLLLAIGGAFAAGVFGGGGGSEPVEASTNVHLTKGEFSVRWPGEGPGQTDPGLAPDVMQVVGKYVDDGVVPTLRTGTLNTAKVGDLFDQGALAQLDDPTARGALFDEKLPLATGELDITSKPIDIVALNDSDNKLVFVSAKVHLDLLVQSDKGYSTIIHKGELVLEPDASGNLKITAWDVKALRTPPGPKPKPEKKSTTSTTTKKHRSATTTASAPSTTTAPVGP